MTLAWVLDTLHVPAAGPALGLDEKEVTALGQFRDLLRDLLLSLSAPE